MFTRFEGLTRTLLRLPRQAKRAIAIGFDAAVCVLAVYLSFYLRLGVWITLTGQQWAAVALSIILAIPVLWIAGVYRTVFRYSGPSSIMSIAQAVLVYGLFYAAIITVIQIDFIPRTVGLIQPAVLFLVLASSRVIAGWWLGGAYKGFAQGDSGNRVVIYGAGSTGRQLHNALGGSGMKVVGFLDDDPLLHDRTILGKPVYPPGDLERLVERQRLSHVLLAIPSASRRRRNEILEMVRPLKVKVQTLPAMADVALGKIRMNELRDLDIDDLLGRDPVAPDAELLRRKIAGEVVMVTGAGGSIGSELCRQILAQDPQALLLVDSSEAALYSIHHELEALGQGRASRTKLVPLIGSVTNADRMRDILDAWRPATIYHAAAYKHVPLVEHNPLEGIFNNAFGTLTVATLCRDVGTADFVLISTDKAVRPTNVMGASKRLAELTLQALAAESRTTRFSMVRFGNVLGSSGSVVPLFRRQIANGGPLTVTHDEMTRYFMTIPEAAQLVIQAGTMAKGGEVFVLDMGEPVRIMDLARNMIELAGLKVHEPPLKEGDIEIVVTGLRPGEKLYEELLIGHNPKGTAHPRVMMANEPFIPLAELSSRLDRMRAAIERSELETVLAMLRELVPEYVPDGELVDFVHLRQLA